MTSFRFGTGISKPFGVRCVGSWSLPAIHSGYSVKLTSAWRKYERGIEQARELCGKTRAFEEAKAYVPNVKTYVRSTKEVEYVVLANQRAMLPDDLALLAGEVVYNLRSALDHAVYALI